MRKSIDYLNDALELIGNVSDSKKANRLGIAKQTLSQYKAGQHIMDDYACFMVARILGIDPLTCVSSANYEREKNEEKKQFWLEVWSEREAQQDKEN